MRRCFDKRWPSLRGLKCVAPSPTSFAFSGWSSRLAENVFFSVRTMLIFVFQRLFFLCVFFCGPGPTATSGYGFNTAVFLDASPSRGSTFCPHASYPPGWQNCAKEVSNRRLCLAFRPRFYLLLYCLQSRVQQCSTQREVSRATLYHPISSQTNYWQVASEISRNERCDFGGNLYLLSKSNCLFAEANISPRMQATSLSFWPDTER